MTIAHQKRRNTDLPGVWVWPELIASAVIVAVAGYFIVKTHALPSSGPGAETFDPRAIPFAILGAICVLSVLVVLRVGRRRPPASLPEGTGAPEGAGDPEGAAAPLAWDGWVRAGMLVGLLVVYAVLLARTGLVLSTVVFVTGALLLLSVGRIRSVVLALCYAVALYLVFVSLLGVRFDQDLIGGLVSTR